MVTVADVEVGFVTYVAWFAAFCAASTGMTIINKIIMKDVNVPYLFLGFQQLVAIVSYSALHFALGARDPQSMWHIKPFTGQQVRRLLVVGVNFTFILATSLLALPLVTVPTVVVFRNFCTCIIAALEYLILGKWFSNSSWVALLLTFVGSLVYAGTDINFDSTGYCWLVANSACFCFGQLYEKWNMSRTTDQTATGVAAIKASLSLPVVGVLAPTLGEFQTLKDMPTLDFGTILLMLVSSLGAIGMGVIYMTLYKIASATATTVAGNFNKIVSIVVGAIVFSSALSKMQVVGLAVCLAGSMWWSLEAVRQRPKGKCE